MKCPGQDSRYWTPGAVFEVDCPQCGSPVEFFKDETKRKCRKCGHSLVNPKMDFGCAAHCKFAAQCLGELPPELVAQRGELLKDRVAVEMKRYFGQDFRRIAHATKVARYADQIGRQQGADMAVVLVAAYLHDIGIREAERLHNSASPRLQHKLGPPVAREILERIGAEETLVQEVCDIIGHHHHPRKEETLNFKCLYDADLLVNLEEELRRGMGRQAKSLERIIEKAFLTEKGKEMAREALLAAREAGT
jgi:putative nucleotidyltransferase with HDIG domain